LKPGKILLFCVVLAVPNSLIFVDNPQTPKESIANFSSSSANHR
jgi:hypothetical protein